MFHNQLRLPWQGFAARWLERLANSAALAGWRRRLLSKLPFLQLRSDVVDVVYANWVVPLDAVRHLLPDQLRLQEAAQHTILTVLTYRHGHFGPALLGPLRHMLPSPLQSNWRLYVQEMPDGSGVGKVVLFIKNIFDSAMYGIGSRLFSDALPSHVAQTFVHQKTAQGFQIQINGGSGSAPSFALEVALGGGKQLPPSMQAFFPTWEHAVDALTQQDSALSPVAGAALIAHAGIDLPIPLPQVQPAVMSAADPGDFLRQLGVKGPAFCFVVPQVPFRVLWERCLRLESREINRV
ncbi:DUF2071 domain-containing protein [Massilia sp. W12]|uniref:DUF2071 domain-containing protein n=1 Tax=Massilia sp. W12 TaxID=3126507 RepID=UPI0030CB686B